MLDKPSASKTGRGLPGMMPALVAAKSTAPGKRKKTANPALLISPNILHSAHRNSLSCLISRQGKRLLFSLGDNETVWLGKEENRKSFTTLVVSVTMPVTETYWSGGLWPGAEGP